MFKILSLFVFSLFFNSCSNLSIEAVRPETTAFKVLWVKNLDPEYNSGNLPIGLSAGAVFDDLLYVGNPQQSMIAYGLNDGRTVWESLDKGSFHSQGAVVDKSFIYGTNHGRLYSRHYLTGELQYEVDLGAAIESPPVFASGRLFVHVRNHKIFALDAVTGKILWAYKRSIPFTTTVQRVATPVVFENRLYVGFSDGQLVSFSPEDGTILWENKISTGAKFIDVDMPVLIHKGLIYTGAVGSNLSVIDPKSGNLLRTLPYKTSRAPILHETGLIISTQDGNVVQLNANDEKVNEVQVSKLGITSVAKWKNSIVVGAFDGNLYRIDLNTFKIIEKFSLGSTYSSIFADFVVSNQNHLVVYTARNRLYVFH